MRSSFSRLVGALALAVAFLAPSVGSAQTALTSAQLAGVQTLTTNYFHAVATGDRATVKALTTHNFKATAANGKSTDADGLLSAVHTAKMSYGGMTGSAKVTSATGAPGVVTALVSMQASADTVGAQGSSVTSINAQHQLTIVKTSSGKWLIAADKVLRSHTTM